MGTFRNMSGGRRESYEEGAFRVRVQGAEANYRNLEREAKVGKAIGELYAAYREVRSDTFLRDFQAWEELFDDNSPFMIAARVYRGEVAAPSGATLNDVPLEQAARRLANNWLDLQDKKELERLSRFVQTVINVEGRPTGGSDLVLSVAEHAQEIISSHR